MSWKRLALLLALGLPAFWASSAWAADIGWDSAFQLARTVVLPEDGSGGISIPDAIQFNIGFTLTAFFGQAACWCRCLMELMR